MPCVLRTLVLYVSECPAFSRFSLTSCFTFSRASRASCPTCCRSQRVSCPMCFRSRPAWYIFYVLLCPTCFVFYVLSCLTCFALCVLLSHHVPCALCVLVPPHPLWALFPYLPLVLRTLSTLYHSNITYMYIIYMKPKTILAQLKVNLKLSIIIIKIHSHTALMKKQQNF